MSSKFTSYSFKSVGQTSAAISSQKSNEVTQTPIGIKTPLELGTGTDGLLKMHKSIENQIVDNFKNLLLTNKGERMFLYDFGANLRELQFELGTESGDIEAINRIKSATEKYLPFIDLQTFETFNIPLIVGYTSAVGIRIAYTVPALSNTQRNIEVVIGSAT